jgi:hypothetical protein
VEVEVLGFGFWGCVSAIFLMSSTVLWPHTQSAILIFAVWVKPAKKKIIILSGASEIFGAVCVLFVCGGASDSKRAFCSGSNNRPLYYTGR